MLDSGFMVISKHLAVSLFQPNRNFLEVASDINLDGNFYQLGFIQYIIYNIFFQNMLLFIWWFEKKMISLELGCKHSKSLK